jgi:phage/plasmid-like protein (TIGR03299 family)
MIYTGPVPWWARNLDAAGNTADGRGICGGEDAISAEELLKRFALDKFRVEKRPAYYFSPHRREYFPVEGEKFLVRTDTGQALGRCTYQWQERQPLEQFAFWDRVVGEGLARYKTAGILDGGKKVFLNLQAPGSWEVRRASGKVDRHLPYLLDSLSFTGKDSNIIAATDVNTVCMNTHDFAVEGSPLKFSISHRGDLDAKYDAVLETLGAIEAAIPEQQANLQALADDPMSTKEFIQFSTEIWLGLEGEDVEEEVAKWFEKATDRSKSILQNKVADTAHKFRYGIGNEGVSGYDALQSFTEYFDHFDIGEIKNKVRRGERAAKALTKAMDGQGVEVKTRVQRRLLERAKR